MSAQIVPAGISVLVNLVRMRSGELARSFVVHVETPTPASIVAASVGARAAGLIGKGARPDAPLVITLNLVDELGRGGVSWQCLTVQRAVARDTFATAVGANLSDMVMTATASYTADQSLPGTPAPNAPTSREVQ